VPRDTVLEVVMVAGLLVIWSLAGIPQCTEVCLGDEQVRLADAAPKGSAQRARGYEEAAQHYRKAVNLTASTAEKIQALEKMASVYDARHLNQPQRLEPILRELIGLQPNDLAPIFRLAKLQEERGFLEDAEQTLLDARRQKPDEIEAYKKLAQFYLRRVTALHAETESRKTDRPAPGPGERDENGVYRVGGSVAPPPRLDRPVYPPEAAAAGVEGVVIAELVIDEAGEVKDARIMRSIPLLDDAALKAVRNWRYEPTVVDGRPVPIRMTVTVNFTTSR
jgi:TonB family protein